MKNLLKRTVLMAIAAVSISLVPALASDTEDMDLDAISICPADAQTCPRNSCLEICVDQGLDPMDCPYLCNQSS